jgi:hypothetical protein
MKFKLLGSEAALGNGTGNGSNFSSATVVRVFNSDTSAHLVSVETAGAVLVGSFTLGAGASAEVQKSPSDEVFADAGTVVKGVAIAHNA